MWGGRAGASSGARRVVATTPCRFVPAGDSPPTETIRPAIAAAPVPPRGSGRSGSRRQRFRARVVRLHGRRGSCRTGEPPAERVDAAAERGRGEMLARPRARHRPPAQRAQVERRAPASRGPDRVRPPTTQTRPSDGRGGRCRGALLRRREAGAASARRREERRTQRRAVGAVPADDDHPTAPRGRGGVVDGDRQVGQPRPGVPCRVVGVDAPRVPAARDEPADDDDPPRSGAAATSVRGSDSGAPRDPRLRPSRRRAASATPGPATAAAPRSRARAPRSGRSDRRPR